MNITASHSPQFGRFYLTQSRLKKIWQLSENVAFDKKRFPGTRVPEEYKGSPNYVFGWVVNRLKTNTGFAKRLRDYLNK